MTMAINELTDTQQLFLYAAGFFAAQVLAENEEYATSTLKVIEAIVHLLDEDEWTQLGEIMSKKLAEINQQEEDDEG